MGLFDRYRRKPKYNPKTGFEVAIGLSKEILQTAITAADLFIGELQHLEIEVTVSSTASGDDESHSGQLFLEFIFLFLHVADRIAFQLLGAENRADFMEQFAGLTFELTTEKSFQDSDKEVKRKFNASLLTMLNQRNTLYGSCKIFIPEKQEDAKDTLFWEFGKIVAETLGRPMDLFVIMTAITIGGEALKTLNIKQVLEKTCD